VAGIALLLGIDRFMGEARAVTPIIGNAVATVAVARWEGALDIEKARILLSPTRERALPIMAAGTK
jgi:aerobic C4-dicarboxylate transport protein